MFVAEASMWLCCVCLQAFSFSARLSCVPLLRHGRDTLYFVVLVVLYPLFALFTVAEG